MPRTCGTRTRSSPSGRGSAWRLRSSRRSCPGHSWSARSSLESMPSPPDGGAGQRRPLAPRSRSPRKPALGVAVRAVLSAISVVVLVPVGAVVLGGFFPSWPVVGQFGRLLNAGLPLVLGAAGVGTGLAALAIALGGRKVVVLLAAAMTLLTGAGVVAYRFVSFAEHNGASYDLVRALDGTPSAAKPDDRIT